MTPIRDRRHWAASRLAIIGGLVQTLVAISILFLPVLVTCMPQEGEMVCRGESYLQLGGNALGYTFLGLMIVAGVWVAASSRDPNRSRAFLIHWLAVLSSAIVVVVAGWGFGIAFAPGAVLILVAALLSA